MTDKVRFGGMALANGVLVHGPRHWAAAVRAAGGDVRVASGVKPIRAADSGSRLLQGPLRLAEVFALLPTVRRALPEAELPFARPQVLGAMAASAAAVQAVRSSRLSPLAQEAVSAGLALGPATIALRGSDLAAYHGAEHISIGSYEHGERRDKEHERCGSHVLGPLLLTSAAGSILAARAPAALRPLARMGAALGAMAASVEIFSWMVANERHPVARALAKPGHELQHRFVTAEPSAEQLEVAEAALAECLRLESPSDGDPDSRAGEAPPT
jgi:uncharacterized protein YqhQ